MDAPCTGTLLRIFIADSDRFEGKPLHEVIIGRARTRKMAGATVLRAVSGFGRNSVLRTAKLLTLSASLPLVIEIVDSEEGIKAFLPDLKGLPGIGLVTMEKVEVLSYEAGT